MCWLYGRKKNKRLQQNKRSLLNEQNLNESKVMTLWRLYCADVEEVRELQLAQPFCSKSVGKEKKKKALHLQTESYKYWMCSLEWRCHFAEVNK